MVIAALGLGCADPRTIPEQFLGKLGIGDNPFSMKSFASAYVVPSVDTISSVKLPCVVCSLLP